MNENVNVCITPKGDKPVLHFSQFDNENLFTVTVLADDGESAAVLTGLDIEFRLRKTDSHVVTIAPESVSDNVITFKTTEQMCACCGQNIASVTLMKDDMIISTLDIFVEIQRDILSGGLTSESDIRNLTTQIEQIVPEVIGDDYYTKTEVDELIEDIPTFDPSNYYNKSDVDGLLADKADSDDVYTKAETDNLLADKADADDVYAKSEVYNKTETDNLLSAKMDNIGYNGIVDDAAIISFNTDSEAPLAIIKGNITPVQSGSGTPSPDNVRPISGFSALNVTRTGVNLFDKSTVTSGRIINGGGNDVSFSGWNVSDYIPVKEGMELYLYGLTTHPNTNQDNFIFFDASKTKIGYANVKTWEYPLTIPSGAKFVKCTCSDVDLNTAQFSLINNATYEAYNGNTYTIAFGQTVYGGVADVTNGKVTLTHVLKNIGANDISDNGTSGGLIELYVNGTSNKKNGQTNMLCNNLEVRANASAYAISGRAGSSSVTFCLPTSDVPDFNSAKTWVTNNPIELVYELATPIEIDTTPVTVSSIAGDNNIYIDTGNLTEIAYFEDVEDNLIKLIKACQI